MHGDAWRFMEMHGDAWRCMERRGKQKTEMHERLAEDRDRAMYRIEIQDLEMELYNDEYKDAGDNPKTLNPNPKS